MAYTCSLTAYKLYNVSYKLRKMSNDMRNPIISWFGFNCLLFQMDNEKYNDD